MQSNNFCYNETKFYIKTLLYNNQNEKNNVTFIYNSFYYERYFSHCLYRPIGRHSRQKSKRLLVFGLELQKRVLLKKHTRVCVCVGYIMFQRTPLPKGTVFVNPFFSYIEYMYSIHRLCIDCRYVLYIYIQSIYSLQYILYIQSKYIECIFIQIYIYGYVIYIYRYTTIYREYIFYI